MQLKHIFT